MVEELDLAATVYDDITGVQLENNKYEFQLRVYEGDIVTDNTPDEKISVDFNPGKEGLWCFLSCMWIVWLDFNTGLPPVKGLLGITNDSLLAIIIDLTFGGPFTFLLLVTTNHQQLYHYIQCIIHIKACILKKMVM